METVPSVFRRDAPPLTCPALGSVPIRSKDFRGRNCMLSRSRAKFCPLAHSNGCISSSLALEWIPPPNLSSAGVSFLIILLIRKKDTAIYIGTGPAVGGNGGSSGNESGGTGDIQPE